MYPYGLDPSYEAFVKAADVRQEPFEQKVSGAGEKVAAQRQGISNNRWDEERYRPGGRPPGHGGGHGNRPGHGGGHGHGNRPPGHGGGHGHHPDHGRGRRHGRPPGAPPMRIPNESASLRSVDSRAIMRCMNDFMYVWLIGGNGFWMFPTFVGPRSIAGYRWGRFGWTYTGFDIRAIKSFTC